MQGFAGKVAVVTGAGSGIGQALARRTGLARGPSWRSATSTPKVWRKPSSISRPSALRSKADRLDVTEREAFLLYAEEVNDHFGKVNQIYNNAGITVSRRHRNQPVQRDRTGDGRRLLGCGERHQSVPAALDRFRRRACHQSLEHCSGCYAVPLPGRLQLGEVRRSRLHPGTATWRLSLAGHPVKVSTVYPEGYQDRLRSQRPDRRRRQRTRRSPPSSTSALASTTPRRAAEIILDGVRKNKPRVLVGQDAVVLDAIVRITGAGYAAAVLPRRRTDEAAVALAVLPRQVG